MEFRPWLTLFRKVLGGGRRAVEQNPAEHSRLLRRFLNHLKRPPAACRHRCDGLGAAPPPWASPGGILLPAGGYKLGSFLGRGGFGEVWSAEAPGGFPAAVKRIFRPIEDEATQHELRALELIRRLNHPCLLKTHAYWRSAEGDLYIIMELADGSLRDRLGECKAQGQQGIPVNELLGYFHDAAEGIDHLKCQNVRHGDIKPDNILIVDNHAKLGDFGLASILLDSQRSFADTPCGTARYMAPEVFTGRVSRQSDQYSWASTYCHLRLGQPLVCGNLWEAREAHCQGNLNLTRLAEPEQKVLRKALAIDPTKRYPTCLDCWRELAGAVFSQAHFN